MKGFGVQPPNLTDRSYQNIIPSWNSIVKRNYVCLYVHTMAPPIDYIIHFLTPICKALKIANTNKSAKKVGLGGYNPQRGELDLSRIRGIS